ncbi:NUDIX hydrolase [Croceimicrobium sp.]|uniref:NUDIX hydrolase n=1 Tax=Croceimicrobium sp. TaxID=2828340 RepID=UPI003BAA5377
MELAQSKSLPGEEAQKLLAPMGRSSLADLNIDPAKVRQAGVLALFENVDDEAQLILTSRTEYPGTHSGQVSFPGGSIEKEDPSFQAAAQRETLEEIGVGPLDYTIWGELSPLYIPPSNFMVHPYLAWAEGPLSLIPEEKEVAAIHHIALERFLADDAIRMHTIQMSNGFKIKSPAFLMDGLVIWGATAMMIAEIRHLFLREKASL